MPDTDRLAARLAAVERALTDGDQGLDDLPDAAALTDRVDDVEERVGAMESDLAELEAAVRALRGYVGNLEAVNEAVERRADAALAHATADDPELTGIDAAEGWRDAAAPAADGDSDDADRNGADLDDDAVEPAVTDSAGTASAPTASARTATASNASAGTASDSTASGGTGSAEPGATVDTYGEPGPSSTGHRTSRASEAPYGSDDAPGESRRSPTRTDGQAVDDATVDRGPNPPGREARLSGDGASGPAERSGSDGRSRPTTGENPRSRRIGEEWSGDRAERWLERHDADTESATLGDVDGVDEPDRIERADDHDTNCDASLLERFRGVF